MIRISLRLLTGLLLSGCTFNNFQTGSFSTDFRSTHTDTRVVDVTVVEVPVKESSPPEVAIKHVTGNTRIRAECSVYKPLVVPEPVKIDFKELEAATTGKEINSITLKNIKDLRAQLINYRSEQHVHYTEYVKRCVVK
jgi:hypothetical protein